MDGSVASPSMTATESPRRARTWMAVVPAPLETNAPVPARSTWWRDLALLVGLMLLSGGMRAWLIQHTEVAARDSIGFIRYALELERLPWAEVVNHSQQHPGYPAFMLLVSWPVRSFAGETSAHSMQVSAQLTSALAGVLLVIPMYYLGRQFFETKVTFWGVALFQCLPVSSRVLADGLSEGTFLLLLVTALLFGVLAIGRGSAWLAGLCGFCGGLAYLTRPEGALAVIAAIIVLAGVQLVPRWRHPWSRWALSFTTLVVAALVAGSPYYAVTGRFTKKPTPERLLEPQALSPVVPVGQGKPVIASVMGIYAPSGLKDRKVWAVQAILSEVIRSYQYVLAVPVLLGLWWFRGLAFKIPGTWVVLILVLLHSLVLWRLGSVVGYVSDRHTLIIVLCGSFTGAAAVIQLGYSLARFLVPSDATEEEKSQAATARGGWLALTLLAGLLIMGMHDTLKPLHINRSGHRDAGLWLAAHANPADPIHDPFCWAHYYAGRVFQEADGPVVAEPGYKPTSYVVLENTDNEHSRLPLIETAVQLSHTGKPVYHWPENKPVEQAKVIVYAIAPR